MRNNRLTALFVLSCLAAAPAFAEKADREKPLNLTANDAKWDQIRKVTVLTGNVVAVQGTMIVHSDQAYLTQDDKGNQTLVANGKPVTFRQKSDPDSKGVVEWIDAQGDRVDYATQTHTAILTGNARVKKGESIVIGNVITYNTETQVVESVGGTANTANKGRVTIIIPPRQAGSAPATDGKKP
ncbi:lipopolysaccharide transport periplasmic protein LptA [Paludibacterium paludis]|uniref:Lipopolysaccharide export system protein LptA n=1 Tax=Paludibacterium paludis TaxID=1225769 RepID=A0A918U718_9NEIS|nr:lipopolysaccharide transport periplasmic protein LptA [Paludibacterium paludis]GGY02635.1 lipopolysaccharide export system protein LptA [Paludibacterium paludis]